MAAGGHLPYAFTEQGVAMLSSVLHSEERDRRQHRDHASVCSSPGPVRLQSSSMSTVVCDDLEKKYDAKFKDASMRSARSWNRQTLWHLQ